MIILTKNHLIFALALVLLILTQQAWCASSSTNQFATDASNSIAPFLVVGELSLLADGKAAKPEMIQGAKALIATGLATEILKYVVGEKRPNSDSDTSFPSGHTSAAFAMATVIADYHPKYTIPAFAVALTIGWSRVEVGAHYWRDVVAGAAIGYFTAKRFTANGIAVGMNGLSYNWKW